MRQRGRNVGANLQEVSSQEASQDGNETSDFVPSASEEVVLPSGRAKWSSFRERLFWTLVLLFSFFGIIAAGHFWCASLVMVIMFLSYREVITLKRKTLVENQLPYFSFLRWYWFGVTIFGTLYAYIVPFIEIFESAPNWARWLVKNHSLATYLLVIFGFILFLLTLRRHSIKYQFSQLAILLLTCIVVVGQGTSQVKVISNGIIWFFISTTGVIANDISAYLFGVAFGKTKLLPRVSPKKTVEGFLAASVITFMWVLLSAEILSHVNVLICPERQLTMIPFAMWREPSCDTPDEFLWTSTPTPTQLRWLIGPSIAYRPLWLHATVLAAFASFMAPFGGLMASAFKRTLKVKDFGDSIPGHGGVTDRFDCQLLMGMFTFLYLRTFVAGKRALPLVGRVLQMSPTERTELFGLLSSELRAILPDKEYLQIHTAFCEYRDDSPLPSS